MHRIRNPAYSFNCTEGSNPSFSATDRFQDFQRSTETPRKAPPCGAFSFQDVQGCLFTANIFRGHIWGHKSAFSRCPHKSAPMPLTKIECDRAACSPGKPYARLADGLGMYLEVTAAGGKYWRMKYRHAGKEKRLALGVYPEVTLADARKRHDKARDALAAREDPAQLKREAKLKRALMDATTFEDVARQWWAHWSGPRSPRHAQYVIRRMGKPTCSPQIEKPGTAGLFLWALAGFKPTAAPARPGRTAAPRARSRYRRRSGCFPAPPPEHGPRPARSR